jgi:Zn-dependent protease with chaperone function
MPPSIAEFYPPNPARVPPHFTRPTLRYRLRAALVVASLFLFLLVYLALIAGFGGLSCLAGSLLLDLSEFDDYSPGVAFWMIGLIGFMALASAILALYFIKGLFKFPRGDDHQGIEITEADHPRLFAFIRQICADTGAPPPATIVLSPEVNAGVFYTCTFWSLFFPVPKNLHIGLGLVNCLNLTEFKAVLAHEFGHFSQRSMRLGTYIYTTNRIISEIIFGRDWLDKSLAAFDPVLNVIRWLLGRMFRVINFAHASLSRQMEFQADLVSVSVSGSEAIIHGLLRTDFAQVCLDHTWSDLVAAGDHGLRTRDMFYHQTKTADYLRLVKDDPTLGVPPSGSQESGDRSQESGVRNEESEGRSQESGVRSQGSERPRVFPPNETVLPPMWASHPPHYERENNCTRIYIPSSVDERPAWVLFDNPDDLRQRVTKRRYELAKLGEALEPKPAEEVQRFIDDDRGETIYVARYHGMYDEGLISPGDLDKLSKIIPSRWEPSSNLLNEHAAIFGPALRPWLVGHRARVKERERLQRLAQKIDLPKDGVFEYRGEKHPAAAAVKLLEDLDKELHADHEHLASLDRRIYLVYMGMAGQIDPKIAQDLEHRYRFHLAVQEMIISLTYWNRQVQDAFQTATATREPTPAAIQAVAFALRQAQDALGRHIVAAGVLKMPAFKNMRAGEPLSFFLDAKPVMHDLFGSEQILNGNWINQITGRHTEFIDKLRRVLFKSLGSLLCCQERLGDKWKARHEHAPARARSLRDIGGPAAPAKSPPPADPLQAARAVLQTGYRDRA